MWNSEWESDLLSHIEDELRSNEMGSIKRSVDINDREVRLRFAKISKASWAELYFDLYRQCFGEDASEEACIQDAEHRLQTLKANFPERYGAA